MSLTPRQQRFVAEYLVDLNATQAALRAGYTETAARVTGPRLLSNVAVCAAIEEGRARLAGKLEVTQERIVQEYARIAFAKLTDAVRWTEEAMAAVPSADLDANTSAAVKSITLKRTVTRDKDNRETERVEHRVEMHDKKGALDSLARHLGMFKADAIDLATLRAMAELGAEQTGGTADELMAEVQSIVEEAERRGLTQSDRQAH